VLSRNEILLAPPKNLTLPVVIVTAVVASFANSDESVDITITTTGGAAVYVVLTTKAQGRFSENAFMITEDGAAAAAGVLTKTVQFIPWGELELTLLRSSVRVEHLQQNL
jgi:hypothetical protein